jgi:hypothetical protein
VRRQRSPATPVSALAQERDRGRVGYLTLNDIMESLIQPLELPLVFLAALVSRGHGGGFLGLARESTLSCRLVPLVNHRPSLSKRGVSVQSQRHGRYTVACATSAEKVKGVAPGIGAAHTRDALVDLAQRLWFCRTRSARSSICPPAEILPLTDTLANALERVT